MEGEVNQVQSPSANRRSPTGKKLPQVGLKGHRRRVVGKIFPCKTCLRPFTNQISARRHAHTHLNSVELVQSSIFHGKCPHCQRMFFGRREFTDHVNAHENRKNHDCPLCKKRFTHKSSFIRHAFVHLSGEEQAEVKLGRRNVCYFCNKRFKRPSRLNCHLLRHTKENFVRRCHVCRKAFSSQQDLTRHRFTHLNEDEKTALVTKGSTRVCLFCRKKFPDNWTYQAHLATHIPEKPFRCDQCGKLFARNGDFKLHKRLHSSNPKPFRCDECGQTFARKDHLTRHKKTLHEKLKDIACPQCGKKFAMKGDMVTHVKGVHLKIRHPCPHCSLTFTNKSNARSHVKKVHPSECRPPSLPK